MASDTFYWARKLEPSKVAPLPNQPWSIFCSPPYDLYVDESDRMLQLITQLIQVAPERSLFVIESDHRFDTNSIPHALTWDVREYPPAVLAIACK